MELLKTNFNYIILVVAVILISILLSRILKYVLNKYIKLTAEKLDTDPTNYNFFKNAINFIIIIIAAIIIMYSIPALKELSITLLAGAGVFAAIVGFASQAAFSNIISGIFIVIFKPFRVGDIITIQTHSGTIEDITLRHTVIKNWENRRVIIPNAIISNETILNSTIEDTKICNFFEIGISYESDTDKAMHIIREEAMKHPNFMDNRSDEDKGNDKPAVVTRILGWADSSVIIRAYIWTEDTGKGFVLKCDLFDSVKKRFNQEGIEIPYPHRTIVYKNNKVE
ncbi:MAG: mechanosensitive ion channel family protein [Ignavibacteria bacterium]|jgi:small-conductance mechanosensitive channel